MITTENLGKTFVAGGLNPFRKPARIRALVGVTLEIKGGETVALVGRNGAGKTTLLKILSTLILPDAGGASVCGVDVAAAPKETRKRIGVVNGDDRSFYWRLSGAENLYLFGAMYDIPPRALRGRLAALTDEFGLSEHAHIPVRAYSAGMKQRLSLARGLLHNPQVLLMDEPGRSADPVFREEFAGKLRDRYFNAGGRTVFFATHSLEEAAGAADRTVALERGRVVYFDSPAGAEELKKLLSG